MTRHYITPIMHPKDIVRGQWSLELGQERTLQRIRKNPEPEVQDVNQPPKGSIPFPTLGEISRFGREVVGLREPAVSLDLETVGDDWIICAGLTAVDLVDCSLGSSVCIHFRVQGGGLYYDRRDDFVRVVGYLSNLLVDSNIAIITHNGALFDIPILERLGFQVNGRLIDTLGIMHCCFSEMPKTLQFTCTFWNGTGVWKTMLKDDDGTDK